MRSSFADFEGIVGFIVCHSLRIELLPSALMKLTTHTSAAHSRSVADVGDVSINQ